jgi:hypothetical protein
LKVSYSTVILKFAKQGEKTGWTYFEIPADVAGKLRPGFKKSFRVKGKIDSFEIKGVSLLPMGNGSFIMPLNASMRKGIGKRDGAMISVKLEEDKQEYQFNSDLLECLEEDKEAVAFFNSLAASHRKYFSKWIETAKTEETYAKRIAMTVNAMARRQSFPEMLREARKQKR